MNAMERGGVLGAFRVQVEFDFEFVYIYTLISERFRLRHVRFRASRPLIVTEIGG